MTNLFVVLYKPYVYADFQCNYEDDYKEMVTTDNPGICGVFTTNSAAQRRIQAEVLADVEGSYDGEDDEIEKTKERIKHLEEMHYYIREYELIESV